MIAHRVFNDGTHWYLDASMSCDWHEYRRPIDGGEDDWEKFNKEWDLNILGGYCEDLLQAYLANGSKIKQVFVKDES